MRNLLFIAALLLTCVPQVLDRPDILATGVFIGIGANSGSEANSMAHVLNSAKTAAGIVVGIAIAAQIESRS
jgi:hypothetical protein